MKKDKKTNGIVNGHYQHSIPIAFAPILSACKLSPTWIALLASTWTLSTKQSIKKLNKYEKLLKKSNSNTEKMENYIWSEK